MKPKLIAITMDQKLINPDWLKYGIPGLAALLAIILYFTFKDRITATKGKSVYITMSIFCCAIIALLSIGGLLNNADNKLKYQYDQNVDHLKDTITSLHKDLAIITNNTPELDLLRKELIHNDSIRTVLKRQNELLSDTVSYQKDILKENTAKLMQFLSDDFFTTNYKSGLSEYSGVADLTFKRLRRMVFDNILTLHADKDLLAKSMAYLKMQYPDQVAQPDVDKILSGFKHLCTFKLAWINNIAIPEYMAKKNNPPLFFQDGSVPVQYPKEVWILDDAQSNIHNVMPLNSRTKLELDRESRVIQAMLLK